MSEKPQLQRIPVKAYQTADRLMVTAPMPGLQPEDITVEVTSEGRLILSGRLRGVLKDVKELLVDEWSVGGYERELDLPIGVDAELANVTYGNGVVVVALPISERTRPARLSLEPTGQARGERVGSQGNTITPTSTSEHQAQKAQQYKEQERG